MTFNYKGTEYFDFQKTGNASRFITPFVKELCKGEGYDIGSNKWPLKGAMPIDPAINGQSGMELPEKLVDYIYSSHCLEHLDNWVEALKHWVSRIKMGGILFLYLPDYSQKYWRPWNNPKHKHVLNKEVIKDYLEFLGLQVFVSGVDLNNSFAVVGIKRLKTMIINLDKRPDRYEQAQKEMERFLITDYNRLPAFELASALWGNSRSHLKCLELGANLIFEDDIFFIDGAREIFEKAVQQLPDDWDMVYLGGNVEYPLKRVSKNLFKCEYTWGTNAILYSEKGRKKVLENYKLLTGSYEIYDEWLRRNMSTNLELNKRLNINGSIELNAYIISPIICWSYGGFSDVQGCEQNYLPAMQENEKNNLK